ncbi:PREDICTED: cytohesin-interacting protein-like [Nanorana parkeri]|uniref:cytohesin-interacting protein-like n=2 Tax=Nanorana parkeri TaxID=125878 RepID=UPI0008546EEE|nr:PREDICTED: cytohesin-interacting protein-like [Nanorana parkeri]
MSLTRHRSAVVDGPQLGNCVFSHLEACSKTLLSPVLDANRSHSLAGALATLPRGHKQLGKSRSNSLIDSTGTEPHRRIVVIAKQDNEPFGFEIQTYKLQYEFGSEMKTYVCKVHENSPSSKAGLKAGDMLTNVNGVNTEGFCHQQTVELMRSSGNFLRIETEISTDIRRSELQARLMLLKQDFRAKYKELQTILRKEHQLLYGTVNEHKIREELKSLHSKMSERSTPGSFLNKYRMSSSSSTKSFAGSITLSEDGLGSMSEYEEDSGTEAFSRQSSIEEDYFILKFNGLSLRKSSLARHRSISITSSESEPMSPNWDTLSLSNFFGTLPRKARRGSIRKHFLRFIPGLQRSVEEEESPL